MLFGCGDGDRLVKRELYMVKNRFTGWEWLNNVGKDYINGEMLIGLERITKIGRDLLAL